MADEYFQVAADKFIFNVKKGILYTENDTWVQVEDEQIRVGATDFLQRRGGDIIFVELPEPGDEVGKHDDVVRLETIKAVLTIASPMGGVVTDVNRRLNDEPELINSDPFGEGWLILLKPSDKTDMGSLLTAERYFESMKKKIDEELKKIKGL
jgi:glycine cleavage system H protein